MKRFVSLFIALILVFSLTSCDIFSDKVREYGELSITLPFDFIEFDIDGFDACYGNSDISVFISEDPIDLLAEQREDITADSTLEDYMKVIVEINSEACGVTMEDVVNEDGLLYYVWSTKDNSDGDYTYFSVVYKSTSSFWFVQIASMADDYERLAPKMKEIAKTVITK